jgi:hypothetical protein
MTEFATYSLLCPSSTAASSPAVAESYILHAVSPDDPYFPSPDLPPAPVDVRAVFPEICLISDHLNRAVLPFPVYVVRNAIRIASLTNEIFLSRVSPETAIHAEIDALRRSFLFAPSDPQYFQNTVLSILQRIGVSPSALPSPIDASISFIAVLRRFVSERMKYTTEATRGLGMEMVQESLPVLEWIRHANGVRICLFYLGQEPFSTAKSLEALTSIPVPSLNTSHSNYSVMENTQKSVEEEQASLHNLSSAIETSNRSREHKEIVLEQRSQFLEYSERLSKLRELRKQLELLKSERQQREKELQEAKQKEAEAQQQLDAVGPVDDKLTMQVDSNEAVLAQLRREVDDEQIAIENLYDYNDLNMQEFVLKTSHSQQQSQPSAPSSQKQAQGQKKSPPKKEEKSIAPNRQQQPQQRPQPQPQSQSQAQPKQQEHLAQQSRHQQRQEEKPRSGSISQQQQFHHHSRQQPVDREEEREQMLEEEEELFTGNDPNDSKVGFNDSIGELLIPQPMPDSRAPQPYAPHGNGYDDSFEYGGAHHDVGYDPLDDDYYDFHVDHDRYDDDVGVDDGLPMDDVVHSPEEDEDAPPQPMSDDHINPSMWYGDADPSSAASASSSRRPAATTHHHPPHHPHAQSVVAKRANVEEGQRKARMRAAQIAKRKREETEAAAREAEERRTRLAQLDEERKKMEERRKSSIHSHPPAAQSQSHCHSHSQAYHHGVHNTTASSTSSSQHDSQDLRSSTNSFGSFNPDSIQFTTEEARRKAALRAVEGRKKLQALREAEENERKRKEEEKWRKRDQKIQQFMAKQNDKDKDLLFPSGSQTARTRSSSSQRERPEWNPSLR